LFTNLNICFLINNGIKVKQFLIHINQMKILVVDDEKKIADVLAERLRLRGFEAIPVYDGASAFARLDEENFDGVVLDLRLPDFHGIDVLRETRRKYPNLRVVILSGHGTDQDFNTCLELGAIACFQKPAKIAKLAQTFNSYQTAIK